MTDARKTPSSTRRRWTGAEIARAAKLWGEGARLDAMAVALGRTKASIAGMMEIRRELFPRRNARGEKNQRYYIYVPERVLTLAKAEAKKRACSIGAMLRDCLIIAAYNHFELPQEVKEKRERDERVRARRIRELNRKSKARGENGTAVHEP